MDALLSFNSSVIVSIRPDASTDCAWAFAEGPYDFFFAGAEPRRPLLRRVDIVDAKREGKVTQGRESRVRRNAKNTRDWLRVSDEDDDYSLSEGKRWSMREARGGQGDHHKHVQ